MNRIVAVIGMCGSGKTEAVKFFEERGFKKVYFGEVVLNELNQAGLEQNEQNERTTRERLRNELGMGVMAIKSLPQIEEHFKSGDVVIESLYSWDEFKIVKDTFGDNFKLLTVYADKPLRYKRLAERKHRPLTEQQAISRDYSEIENLDKGGPIAFTDYLVINNSTIEDLRRQLEKCL